MEARKPVQAGLDFIRGDGWLPVIAASVAGARRLGNRRMPRDLKRTGFETFVSDVGDHYRVSYGKKTP